MTPQRPRAQGVAIAALVVAACAPVLTSSARGDEAAETFPFDRERPAAGRFIGEAAWPGEEAQPVEVRLAPPAAEGAPWEARIARLAAGVTLAALESVSVDGRRVSFVARSPRGKPATFRGEVAEDGQTLRGEVAAGEGEKAVAIVLGRLPLVADLADAEHYKGDIELPAGGLGLYVSIARTPGGRSVGRLDIPLQGAFDLTLTAVEVDGRKVALAIPGPKTPVGPAVLRGERSEDGKRIAGKLVQGPISLPFALERVETRPTFARPQTPREPLPYQAIEVKYENAEDRVALAGTLTVPPGKGPFPAVLLLTGSGAQDRDETLLGHKPFLVLADHLTRAGVAVLRADDRGVGGSSRGEHPATSEDFAEDALAGVAFLRTRPEVDPKRIGLVGHSEGGLIAPMAAARGPDDVAFIVLLAGPGVSGDEVLLAQAGDAYRGGGFDDESVERCLGLRRKLFDLIRSGAPDDELSAAVKELVAAEILAAPAEKRPKTPTEQLAAMAAVQFLDPWVRFFVAHDPRPALAKVRCPVLAVNGTLDTQVSWERNLPEIARALAEGKNRDFTIRAFVGLNHLFQTAGTGKLEEYAEIEETFAPSALRAISSWIVERTGS